jgi:hypothetical protein
MQQIIVNSLAGDLYRIADNRQNVDTTDAWQMYLRRFKMNNI